VRFIAPLYTAAIRTAAGPPAIRLWWCSIADNAGDDAASFASEMEGLPQGLLGVWGGRVWEYRAGGMLTTLGGSAASNAVSAGGGRYTTALCADRVRGEHKLIRVVADMEVRSGGVRDEAGAEWQQGVHGGVGAHGGVGVQSTGQPLLPVPCHRCGDGAEEARDLEGRC
jgi:hypothetical protein